MSLDAGVAPMGAEHNTKAGTISASLVAMVSQATSNSVLTQMC